MNGDTKLLPYVSSALAVPTALCPYHIIHVLITHLISLSLTLSFRSACGGLEAQNH